MRAIVIARPGGPEVLELRDVPTPEPVRGEVRVRVHATAVNRADLLQREGHYPAPADCPADIPGLEYAGVVDKLGDGVTELSIGDRVFGLVGGGAYAEYLVTHARTVAKIPEGIAFVEAAAIPEAFITAYDALVTRADLKAGETVLVHAVGSGVGTAAIQIVRALGARSFGTARTLEKVEKAKGYGLEDGVAASNGKFESAIRDFTHGRGVDVILDLVGGNYIAEDILCAAPRARIIVIGLVAGTKADLDLGAVLRKRLTLEGTVLRSRPLEEKIEAAQAFIRHVVPLLDGGAVRPVVSRVLGFDEVAQAHRAVESNEGFGKVVITVT